MLKEEVVKKYKDEERLLISKVLDKIELADRNMHIQSSDFLNLNEQALISKILNQIQREAILYGGYENAERKMLFVIPDKLNKSIDKINYNEFFGVIRIKLSSKIKEKYTHRNYLGALIKLGLKREKIGDILVDNDGADIIASKEIIKFLYINLPMLKRFEYCNIQEIGIESLKKVKLNLQYRSIQVSSMRLDNIISELMNTSRSKASQIILEQRVFLNYVCETKVTKLVKENDIITIRGKGRFKIDEIIGNTRKGKINIKIEYFF